MLRIIKFLFTGVWVIHHHEWEIISECELTYTPNLKTLNYGTKYVLKCKDCGEMKTFISGAHD